MSLKTTRGIATFNEPFSLRSLQQENDMAKGNKLKGNKEARKPKTEKPKGSGSAYKQGQSKAGVSTTPFVRKTQLG